MLTHLRHGLREEKNSTLPEADRGGRKRDHRKLGRELDLFHFQEEGPGVVFWHPKGWTIFQQLIAYMWRRFIGDTARSTRPDPHAMLWRLQPLGLVPRKLFAAQSAGDDVMPGAGLR
jgi:threonyl-tRNA synthetase